MENESQKRRKDIERAAQQYGALESASSILSGIPVDETKARSRSAVFGYPSLPEQLQAKNESVLTDDISRLTSPEMSRLQRMEVEQNPGFFQMIIRALRGR